MELSEAISRLKPLLWGLRGMASGVFHERPMALASGWWLWGTNSQYLVKIRVSRYCEIDEAFDFSAGRYVNPEEYPVSLERLSCFILHEAKIHG